ncbi:hypothetical protein NFI96_002847 [Prochilodus magdalenae]|nr:hypothetical protein NFI96_002847 [Prochilodus magdalenae]
MDVQLVVMKEWMNKASYGGCSKADGVQDLHREPSHTDNMLPALCTLFTALSCVSGVIVVTQTPPVLTATKGEKITMHCNLGTVTGYAASWNKQVPGGVPQYVLYNHHSYSSPYYGSGFSSPKFTSTHSSQSDYTLIISNVEAGDSAVYYCQTYDGSASVSGVTVVTQKPPVLTATKGEKITMHCNLGTVTNRAAPWYKQVPGGATQYVLMNHHSYSSPYYGSGFSSPKFTSTHSSQSDYTLIISNVEAGDSAVYYCSAWDSSASASGVMVLTQKPPVLTLTRGERATMDCNMGAVTDYSFHWYKQVPGRAPQHVIIFRNTWSSPQYGSGFSSPKFTSTCSSTLDCSLIISNVEAGDSAVYHCATWDTSAMTLANFSLVLAASGTIVLSHYLVTLCGGKLQAGHGQELWARADEIGCGTPLTSPVVRALLGVIEVSWTVNGTSVTDGVYTSPPVQQPDKTLKVSSSMAISASMWKSNVDFIPISNKAGVYIDDHRFRYFVILSHSCMTPSQCLTSLLPPSPEELQQGSATLLCLAEELTVPLVQVSWTVNGTSVTDGVYTSPPVQQPDKTLKVSSSMAISASMWKSNVDFMCEVSVGSKASKKTVKQSSCF